MRLEQLVLFGPSDNFTVGFGPRVSVLAGLEPDERAALLATLVDAMAGRVPNASVVFIDGAGRRVFADRMGATYADDGKAAPSLASVVGSDPRVVEDLVAVRAEHVGAGDQRTTEAIEADLTGARAAREQAAAARAEALTRLDEISSWEAALADVDEQIDRAADDAARWSWTCMRDDLDALRAELASLDQDHEGERDGDVRLLAAVEDLREAGQVWLDADAEADEVAERLGPLPDVPEADLQRLVATPATAPASLDEQLDRIAACETERRRCQEAVERGAEPPDDPGDGIVLKLAAKPQDELWATHRAAVDAQERYEQVRDAGASSTEPDEVEASIEEAHHEVVRRQRAVERRFRPGMLGSALLAVAALLVGDMVSVLLGAVLLVASVAVGWWLLVLPRRSLAEANRAESGALGDTDADSWLGLHLRRIDGLVTPADRAEVAQALERRTSTSLDWEAISEGTSLGAASEREDAIRAYADKVNPQARAAAERRLVDDLAEAAQRTDDAKAAVRAELEPFGLADANVADLDADQLRIVLDHRIAAGSFARDVVRLRELRATAQAAGHRLETMLHQLGFDDGNMAGRLDRAVVAVEEARQRRLGREATRTHDEISAEIDELAARVDQGRRLAWDLTPAPTGPPTDPAELMERRQALHDRIAAQRRPDMDEISRREAIATERVARLDHEAAALAAGPVSIRRRLADRIARTTWVGSAEENLPIVIDDALVDVEPAELFKLLDMVVRLSERTQIIYLTGDPTVARWARREAAAGIVSLLEPEGVAIY